MTSYSTPPGFPDYPGDDVYVAWFSTRCARPACPGQRWHHIANDNAATAGTPKVWGCCDAFIEPGTPPEPAAVRTPSPTPPPAPTHAQETLTDPTATARDTEIVMAGRR